MRSNRDPYPFHSGKVSCGYKVTPEVRRASRAYFVVCGLLYLLILAVVFVVAYPYAKALFNAISG